MVTEPIAVIVVTWNGIKLLQTCLAALMAQTVKARVLVVDNASTDGSVEWVRRVYPQVHVLANAANAGFAQANNQGIAASYGEYVALLNNDATPEPQWLEGLLLAAESDRSVGMVASHVALSHAPDTVDSAGIEVDVLGMAWNRHLGMPVDRSTTEPMEVFGPSGSAALFRRRMLDEIGAFDARYFAYYEDVDLAWRAQRAGWRCLFAPTARVLHVHSATARRLSGFKAYHIGQNKWRTLFKHYPFRRLAPWVPWMLLVDTLAWAAQLARGDVLALKGRRQAWRERRIYWSERQAYGDVARVAESLCGPRLDRLFKSSGSIVR